MKPSCSDTLMSCVPGVSPQGVHEEAAPSRPDCSMGFPGRGKGGSRVCLRRNPSPVPSRRSVLLVWPVPPKGHPP